MIKEGKKRLSQPRKIFVAGLAMTLIIILYIHFTYYAAVLNLSSVISLIVTIIVFLLSKNEVKNLIVLVLITGSLLAFCMAMILPTYTYSQASELIQNEQSGELIEEEQKNVLVQQKAFNVFSPSRFYRFVIEHGGAKQEYMVKPDSGEVIQIVKR